MDAWIYDAVRTPRGKARPDGSLAANTPQQLGNARQHARRPRRTFPSAICKVV